jgi:hypothetical protein
MIKSEKNEMDGECSVFEGEERYVEGFMGKPGGITWKT